MERIKFYRPPKLSVFDYAELGVELGNILNSGILTTGENVSRLEDAIRKRYHVDHVVAFSSGTSALGAALSAVQDIHFPLTRDQVFFVESQAFTWHSVLHVIGLCAFADIDQESWLMKPGWHCPVVIATHTFGNTFEVERPVKWDGHVIYDAAESFGAKITDFGDATIFSFAPTKSITTMEGGAVLTNDLNVLNKVCEIRKVSGRMSEIHAAIGLRYLKHLDQTLERKRDIANYYKAKLPFRFQKTVTDHSYGIVGALFNEYSLERVQLRTSLPIVAELEERGLETRRYYRPLTAECKVTNEVYSKMICLPCYPAVDEQKVVDIIRSVIK